MLFASLPSAEASNGILHSRRTSSTHASTSESNGRFSGRSVRLRKQHQCRHRHHDVKLSYLDDGRKQRAVDVVGNHQSSETRPQARFPKAKSVQQPALEPHDYAFYQEMDPDSITEQFLWSRLEPKLGYLQTHEQSKVKEALCLAYDAHKGQRRRSGEPFISHPVEVTRILAELKSEPDTLVAGLLHDTVEDTDLVTLEEIEVWFGYDCARIVEGETKFSKLSQLQKPCVSKEDLQALDLQQLFLAMTEDARIIIVKLADRLHNMRTMGSMPAEKQKKIGTETLAMFAPLASLLGLYSIKTELEDLSMKYCMPALYDLIKSHRAKLIANQENTVLEARAQLEAALRADVFLAARCESMDVVTNYRSVYSIYKRVKAAVQKRMPHVPLNDVPVGRMQQLIKGHNVLADVTEIAQLGVVITEHDSAHARNGLFFTSPVQLCYQVLGVLHSMWAPVPGSIKDFISTPKRNGYQGLHTSLLPLGCKSLIPLEVQVRTASMQELANYGIAADSWSLKPPPAPTLRPTPRRGEAAGGLPRPGVRHRSVSPATAAGRIAAQLQPGQWLPAQHAARVVPLDEALAAPRASPAAVGDFANAAVLLHYAMQAARCHNGATPFSPPNAAATPPPSNGANGAVPPPSNGANGAAPPPSSEGDFTQRIIERYAASSGAVVRDAAAQSATSPQFGSHLTGAIVGDDSVYEELANGVNAQPPPADEASEGDALQPSSDASGEPDWGFRRRLGSKLGKDALERRVNWLNSIREWQQEFLGTVTAQEFVQCIREDLLSQTVFVFTPLGDIMRLPMGATVVDFAYHVHSEVGNTMTAAKVNGRPVHPGYELCNADVVEIVQQQHTSRAHREHAVALHKAWLEFAKTRSARYKLNKFIKEEQSSLGEGEGAAAAQAEAAVEADAPGAAGGEFSTWLVVECTDRAGILAEVATLIHQHGLNVQAYSGSTPANKREGSTSFMNFQLMGDKDKLSDLGDKLSKIEAVLSWSLGGSSPDSVTSFDALDRTP